MGLVYSFLVAFPLFERCGGSDLVQAGFALEQTHAAMMAKKRQEGVDALLCALDQC